MISFISDGLFKNCLQFWTVFSDWEAAGAVLRLCCNLHTPVMQLRHSSVTGTELNAMLEENSHWNPPFMFSQTLFTARFTQNSLRIIQLSTNYCWFHPEQCRELIPRCSTKNQSPTCSSGIQQLSWEQHRKRKFLQKN